MSQKGKKRDTLHGAAEKAGETKGGVDVDFLARINAFADFGIMPAKKKKPRIKLDAERGKLASIPLTSRIKRPVQPVMVIVDGVQFAENPELLRRYQEEMAAYPAKVLEAKAGIIRELEDAEVSREERGDTMLRYECDVKGIDNTGVRQLLLERLAKHDRGEAVITKTLKTAERIDGKAVVSALDTHQTPTMYPKGKDGFLCLNHDLLRKMILPHVGEGRATLNRVGADLHMYVHAQGVHTLFALARTCKYLHDDAMHMLREVSRRVFGGNPAYTPLAYSCYLYYCAPYKASVCDMAITPDHVKTMCRALHLTHSKCIAHLRSKTPPSNHHLYWYRQRGHGHEAIKRIIMFAVETWGSIEGVLQERKKAKERAALKEQEKASVFSKAVDRMKGINSAVTETFGLPPILREEQPVMDEKKLPWTLAGNALLCLGPTAPAWLDKMRGHIVFHRPITLKPILTELETYMEPLVTQGIKHRTGNRAKRICWLADAIGGGAKWDQNSVHSLFTSHCAYMDRVLNWMDASDRRAVPWRLAVNCGTMPDLEVVDDEFVEKFVRWTVSAKPRVHTPDTLLTTPVQFTAWAAGGGATRESFADYVMFIWLDFRFPPHTFAFGREKLANGEAYQMIVESRSVFRSVPGKIRPVTTGWSINHVKKVIGKPPPPKNGQMTPDMGIFVIAP